jgi:hypothetical protein
MTRGTYQPGLSFREYVAIGKDKPLLTVNASLLKKAITPLHGKYYLEQEESEGSDALSLGDAVHKAVLEPDAFDNHFDDFYLQSPTKGLDTKAANEARLLNPGRILVNDQIIEKTKWMRQAILKNKLAAHLLGNCTQRELTGITPDPAGGGFIRKIRIDACEGIGEPGRPWSPYLLDIKSFKKDLTERNVKYEIIERGYDLQAAFYLDTDQMITGQARETMFFIFVTNFAPYTSRVFALLPEQIEKARGMYQHRLAALITAYQTGQFEAWENEMEPVAVAI